jgi:hypothetical protein
LGKRMLASHFWADRRVFLTGHTGFLGAWTALTLQRLNASVTGYAVAPRGRDSFYEIAGVADGLCDVRGDIGDAAMLDGAMRADEPEIVIHMANASHESDPLEALRVNGMGAALVLDVARNCPSVQTILFVTNGASSVSPTSAASFSAAEHAISAGRHRGEPGAAIVAQARVGDLIGGGHAAPGADGLHVMDAVLGCLGLIEYADAHGAPIGVTPIDARQADVDWATKLSVAQARDLASVFAHARADGADMRALARAQVEECLRGRLSFAFPGVPFLQNTEFSKQVA